MSTPDVAAEGEILEEDYEESAPRGHGPGVGGGGGKPKAFGPSFKRMMGLLSGHGWGLSFVALLAAGGVALTVAAPKVLARATNLLFAGFVSSRIPAGTTTAEAVAMLRAQGENEMANIVETMNVIPGQGVDMGQLGVVLLIVIALYTSAAVLLWAQGYILNRIMVKSIWKLRERVEQKINRLPISYFDKMRRGDLISRVTNDIDNITNTLQQSLSGAVTAVFTIVGVLAMMLSISWQITLIVLTGLPLIGLIFFVIGPRSQRAFTTQWKKVGRLNARVEESFSGHALVKTFNQEAEFDEAFGVENEELYQASFRAQVFSGVMMPSSQFVGNLVYVAVAVVGGVMVAGGTMTLGNVQAFIQYAHQFNEPVSQLGGMAVSVQSGVASTERIFEILDAEDETPDCADPEAPNPGAGKIAFEHVRFSYDPDKPLITDLSFEVEPAQTVAIVGPTGAGKTTLVNLLMRFYELDGGKIMVNGQNIADLTRNAVRARTGMVLQDPWLFEGTIRDNIRFGNESATDEQIEAAAKATYVDHMIESLPNGYDTLLEEDGSNLSAGERQLLTIVRAFVAEPSILILDEATSSVDTRTELLLQNAMNALREGRTSFVIAHRLSTIRDADLILVMEDGDIVEQGTHAELVSTHGAYWKLYNAQFHGAQGDE